MKVIFIISSLKAHAGAERIATLLANELCSKYDIEIINRNTDKQKSSFAILDKVKLTKMDGSLISFYFQLKAYLRENSSNLVVVHNMGKLSLFAALLFVKNKMWTYEHVAKSSRGWWVRTLSKLFYRRYSKIITITKSDALSYTSYSPEVITLNNPSPYRICYDYDFTSKTVVAIGRLTYQKGFDNLISAWAIVSQRYPDWSLSIYGDGEDRHLLDRQIKMNKIDNIFIYSATADINLIYKKASFLVMSSRYEGLGMVLVEAQTFSLPTISFDCQFGPSEIITHEQDGLLVENQNINKLADAMESLIINPEKRIFFSKNASESAKRFSKEKIIAKWEGMLNKELSD